MTAPVRLLLADDHRAVRDGLASLLAGYPEVEVVGQAENGALAVEAAAALVPDVVLMDLLMPVMDGVEATRRIVAANPSVRVLVLTSFAEGDKVRAAVEAGATGYALKDARPEDLLRSIATVAAGHSPIDPRAARAFLDHDRVQPPAATLSPREQEVLDLLGKGLSNRVIAIRLGISEATVKSHLTQIYRQIGVTDRAGAAAYVTRRTRP